jgi:hypothetical protein
VVARLFTDLHELGLSLLDTRSAKAALIVGFAVCGPLTDKYGGGEIYDRDGRADAGEARKPSAVVRTPAKDGPQGF